jgi:hypothetical protein
VASHDATFERGTAEKKTHKKNPQKKKVKLGVGWFCMACVAGLLRFDSIDKRADGKRDGYIFKADLVEMYV